MIAPLHDLTHALRLVSKWPGFSLAVTLTLALGIGASTSVFSLINAIAWRPLPYPDSDRLYTLFEQDSLGTRQLASYPTFRDWQEQADAFDGLAYIRGTGLSYQTSDQAGFVLGAFVSSDFFPTLDVGALRGRTILADDYLGGGRNVAVLSNRTWQGSFGGDQDVVGRTITIANALFTIVGVMPATFAYPDWGMANTDMWLPINVLPPQDMIALEQRDFHADSRIVGRLAPGIQLETAETEMDTIARRLAAAYPEASARWTRVSIQSVKSFTVGDMQGRLLMLGGAVAVVLLICCVNLANLYLAQGAARSREFAIRAALGAGRSRVLRQLLTETVVLTSFGGALGVVAAVWAVNLVRVHASQRLPRVSEIGMDGSMLTFAALLTVSTAGLFAIVAARRVAAPHLAEWLGDRNDAALGGRRNHLPSSLLAAQVGLTVVLLVGAGLLIQTYWRLSEVDPGFNPNRLILTMINPPSPEYDAADDAAALFDRVAQSISAVPGVEEVALINHAPVSGGGLPSRVAIGQTPTGSADDIPVFFFTVSDGYFSMIGIPIVQGREFTRDDVRGPPGALIVSEALARAWGDRSPVGERLGVLKASRVRADYGEPLLGTVVGVAGDIKHVQLAGSPVATVYVPYTHNVWSMMTVVARTALEPVLLLREVEQAVRLVDPAIPLDGPGLGAATMDNRMRRSTAQQRLNAGLVSAFAVVALLLAAVGIYGVTSYTVALTTQEIGIRMALGAAPSSVLLAVIGRVARVTVLGLIVGTGGALALTRLIAGLLYQVRPTDPATFIAVALLLLVVAAVAGYVPARRASRVNPVITLRSA